MSRKLFDGVTFHRLLLTGVFGDAQLAYRMLFVYFKQRLLWRFANAGVWPNDREDLLQESLMSVVKSWVKIEDPQATEAWIYTVADRNVAKYWKTHSRNEQIFLDLPSGSDSETEDFESVEEHWLAVRELANSDLDVAVSIGQALEKLRELDEMTMQLLIWMAEGYSYADIGDWIGCEDGTARERVSKAMQKALQLIAPMVPTSAMRFLKRGVTTKLRAELGEKRGGPSPKVSAAQPQQPQQPTGLRESKSPDSCGGKRGFEGSL